MTFQQNHSLDNFSIGQLDFNPGTPDMPTPPPWKSVTDKLMLYSFLGFFVLGVFGNTLNLCVLNRREMRAIQTNTNRFLTAMAVADLGFFLTMLPLKIKQFPWVERIFPKLSNNSVFVVWLIMPVVNFFSTASIWLAIAVSVERLIAFRRPLLRNAYEYSGKLKIYGVIVFIFACAALINVFEYYWFRVVPCKFPLFYQHGGNVSENFTFEENGMLNLIGMSKMQSTSGYYDDFTGTNYPDLGESGYDYGPELTTEPGILCVETSMTHDNDATAVYVVISAFLFACLSFVLPLSALIVLGTGLFHYIKKSGEFLQQERKAEHIMRIRKRERRVLFMVLGTVISFVIFNCLSGVALCWLICTQYWHLEENNAMYFVQEVSNVLVTTGKALNFIIYCSANYNFRKHLIHMLRLHRVACIRDLLPKRYLVGSSAQTTTGYSRWRSYHYVAVAPEPQVHCIDTSEEVNPNQLSVNCRRARLAKRGLGSTTGDSKLTSQSLEHSPVAVIV